MNPLGAITEAIIGNAIAMGRSRIVIVFSQMVVLVGCGSEDQERGAEPRDSAGVVIVENGAIDVLPEAFHISTAIVLDLGGMKANADHELNATAPFPDAVRMSDGRFVVVDNYDLKVFDAAGQYLFTIGRRGQGPGEFRQVRGACVAPGDTIIAIHNGPRFSVFDRNGTHANTFTTGGSHVEASGCVYDGSVLVHSDARPNLASVLPREHGAVLDRLTTVHRLGKDGANLGMVGEFPAESANPFFQTVANTVPHRGHIYVGDGRLPEVRVHRLDGTLTRIIRWSAAPIPVTPELLVQRVRQSIPSDAPAGTFERRMERARTMPRPAIVPVYFRIEIDATGRLWVQDHPIGSTYPWPWTVFDSAGHALGPVSLPRLQGVTRIDIRSIGRDTVLLHWKDEESGFPHLTFHALEKVGPTPASQPGPPGTQ